MFLNPSTEEVAEYSGAESIEDLEALMQWALSGSPCQGSSLPPARCTRHAWRLRSAPHSTSRAGEAIGLVTPAWPCSSELTKPEWW